VKAAWESFRQLTRHCVSTFSYDLISHGLPPFALNSVTESQFAYHHRWQGLEICNLRSQEAIENYENFTQTKIQTKNYRYSYSIAAGWGRRWVILREELATAAGGFQLFSSRFLVCLSSFFPLCVSTSSYFFRLEARVRKNQFPRII